MLIELTLRCFIVLCFQLFDVIKNFQAQNNQNRCVLTTGVTVPTPNHLVTQQLAGGELLCVYVKYFVNFFFYKILQMIFRSMKNIFGFDQILR